MKQEYFTAQDGVRLLCQLWCGDGPVRGVVQIITGTDPDIKQYARFARFLVQNGYAVFVSSHRQEHDTDIYSAIVSDELEILHYLKTKFNVPVFLFGYGFGSFITQSLMDRTNLCAAGVCMASTGRYSRAFLWAGLSVSWIGQSLWGRDACARFIDFFSPLRDKCFSYGFYYSLFKNLMRLNYISCPDMPLLIISGGRDSYCLNGRLAMSLYRAYGGDNVENLTLIIYPGARHELLHDDNYNDVYRDILEFLDNSLKTK